MKIKKNVLTSQALAYLRTEIRKGAYAGGRLPKEVLLAKTMKISRTTLRKALSILEKEGKIVRLKHRGTFVSGSTLLETPRLKKLGLICLQETKTIEDLSQDPLNLYRNLIPELLKTADEKQYSVTSLIINQESPARSLDECARLSLDAFILLSIRDEKILESLVDLGKPLLQIGHWTKNIEIDTVNPDLFQQAYLAISHLVERGHRKIAFINRSNLYTINDEAYAGYRKVLIENQIPMGNLIFAEARASLQGGFDSIKNIFKTGKKPTAAFCFCDAMARGVLKAATQRELKMPGDFSLICLGQSSFTSIELSRNKMAKAAIDQILKRMKHPGMAIGNIKIEGKLVDRETTGLTEKKVESRIV